MKISILVMCCFLTLSSCAQSQKKEDSATVNKPNVVNDKEGLDAQVAVVSKKIEGLMQEYQALPVEKQQDEQYIQSIQEKYEGFIAEIKEIYKTFILNNPDSQVSILTLGEYAQMTSDISEVEPLFNSLSSAIQNTNEGQAISKQIALGKITAVGAVAPDFTQNDPKGNPVKLSDFRGKYLLIDFWASWCRPCREENPNVVKAYQQYKNKNFEILGVSLDNSTPAWEAAIEKDELTWPQVSDLKGWKNEVAVQYNVLSVPQNLLLDPNGVIIAKNLRGKDLSKSLEKYLK